MTCESLQPLWLVQAVDPTLLGDDERAALRQHGLAGCPACAGAQAEADAIVAMLLQASPRAVPSPAAADRLRARISPGPMRRTPGGTFGGWPSTLTAVAAAAVLAIVATVAVLAGRESRLHGELASARQNAAYLRVKLDAAGQSQLAMASPTATFASLGRQPTQPADARGRVVVDPDRQVCHLYVFNLNPLPAGRAYELWLIDDQQRKLPMGTFTVDNAGTAHLATPLPATLPALVLAAITDEPAGGVPQPTGAIQLAGKL